MTVSVKAVQLVAWKELRKIHWNCIWNLDGLVDGLVEGRLDEYKLDSTKLTEYIYRDGWKDGRDDGCIDGWQVGCWVGWL